MTLRAELLAWFDRNKRDLPWRRTRDPYAIWLSEVMLQQTQVATVIPYWQRFLQTFPDVASLARAELPEVFSLWSGLGYYSRARNLHRAAQAIVAASPEGNLPSTAAQLLELPGFGRYTAGAVASIAFGEAAPLVDGNVARVFSRLFVVEGAPGDREREKRLWSIAEEWVGAGERPGDWNQALMELGATVCRVDAPACLLCPVRAHCGALREGRVESLPPPRVRPEKQQLRLAAAVCRKGETILLARRAEGGLFGGLWELPSIEVPVKSTDARVRNAIAERWQARSVGEVLGAVKRVLTHRALTIDVFEVEGIPSKVLRPDADVQEWRWVTAEEAGALGMSTAMTKAFALAIDAARKTGRVSIRGRRANAVSAPGGEVTRRAGGVRSKKHMERHTDS